MTHRDPFFIIFMTRETKELYNMTMKNSQNLSQSTFSKNYFYWKNLRRLAKKKKRYYYYYKFSLILINNQSSSVIVPALESNIKNVKKF